MFRTCTRPLGFGGVLIIVLVLSDGLLRGQKPRQQSGLWSGWTYVERQNFVNGYMLGYLAGLDKGCEAGLKDSLAPREVERMRNCRDNSVNFSEGTDYFTKAITNFYKLYPKDGDISPDEVLEELGKGLSPEQIDKYPFMRHKR